MAETGRARIEAGRRRAPAPRAPASADDVRRWVVVAATAAADKQAGEVVVLEVGEVLAITDWFVICDGASDRQVKTIVEEVERRVKDAGGPPPISVEGQRDRQWVLLDFGDFVVHVFTDEARRYYDLERLWADVFRLDWETEAARSGIGPPSTGTEPGLDGPEG